MFNRKNGWNQTVTQLMILGVVLKVEEGHVSLIPTKEYSQSMNGNANINTNGQQPGIALIEVLGALVALEM